MSAETQLRDDLAVDRTHLANERTLLAYVRTGLALLAAGAGLIQFVTSPLSNAGGWFLIACGALVLPLGVLRFFQVRAHIHHTDRVRP